MCMLGHGHALILPNSKTLAAEGAIRSATGTTVTLSAWRLVYGGLYPSLAASETVGRRVVEPANR